MHRNRMGIHIYIKKKTKNTRYVNIVGTCNLNLNSKF